MFALLLAIIYISFISLGLPDAILGGAWPLMYGQFGVPVSFSGIVFFIISAGTVISSLMSDRLTKRFGTAKLTAVSVGLTAAALLGFSFSDSFILLCIWAVPYGLGAGSVDAALNNYVALHYKSRHMSWLHCMWGVGAATGPYILSAVLTTGHTWNHGYRVNGIIQVILCAILFISLPLWKRNGSDKGGESKESSEPIPLKKVVRFRGAIEVMVAFFCYSAVEQTASLWASGYLVLGRGIGEVAAAGFAALFFLGITGGRFLSGFLTFKFDDTAMIRIGEGITLLGVILIFIPNNTVSLAGLIIAGLGCAPVYPAIIHSTPQRFGADRSGAMVGIQMAAAYVGTTLMPPLFGLIADNFTVKLFPFWLLIFTVLMTVMTEILTVKTSGGENHA